MLQNCHRAFAAFDPQRTGKIALSFNQVGLEAVSAQSGAVCMLGCACHGSSQRIPVGPFWAFWGGMGGYFLMDPLGGGMSA
eukprot:363354-Chlamydomonas_euryale.AAC.4